MHHNGAPQEAAIALINQLRHLLAYVRRVPAHASALRRTCVRTHARTQAHTRARSDRQFARSLARSLAHSLARRSERASEFISDKVWFICMLRLGEGRLLRPASEVTSCPHAQGRCVCGPRQERCDRIVLDACQGAFDAGNDARRQHHLQSVRRRPCLQLPAP